MVILKNQALLLKTQNEESVDKYETLLTSNNIHVKLVRTLVFEYKNIDTLAKKLAKQEDYQGIIFSSPRCVQATNLASKSQDLTLWKLKDNFAVGETTKLEAFKKLQLKCAGQDTGTAGNLAKFIITDKSKYTNPFLYPHGSLKTDILTNELGNEGIELDSVMVYETLENPDIKEEIREVTNNFHDIAEFVVFFSPSGLRSSIKYLRTVEAFTESKLIAIGPTTELAMIEEKLLVYKVAKRPAPQDVLEIILEN